MSADRNDSPEPTPAPELQPAATVAAIDTLTPEALEQVNAARRRVAEARRDVLVTKSRLDDAKANHKAAVASMEEEQYDLERLLDDLLEPPKEPFTLQSHDPARPVKPIESPWEDSEWRGDDLKDAIPEVGGYILGILAESEIATMGQLADWCSSKRLTQIAGIGDASADKIDDALAAYWQRKREARPPVADAVQDVPAGEFPPPDDDDDAIEFDGDEEDAA